MLSDCLKCWKNTEIRKPKTAKKTSVKPMLSSKWTVFGSKKVRVIKQQGLVNYLLQIIHILKKSL